MAMTWEIYTEEDESKAQTAFVEGLAEGRPTIIFDRGARIHPSEITGLRWFPKERADELAFIDLTNTPFETENRWCPLHVLKPESLNSDLSFLARSLDRWLGPLQEKSTFAELSNHTGEIDKDVSVLSFLVSLYFDEKPVIAEKALGGLEGVKTWRRFLRALGQGRSKLIFEDPWFSILFLHGGEHGIPADAPLLLVPLFTPQVSRQVASCAFEIILDRAVALRMLKENDKGLDIFLSDAEDLWSVAKSVLDRLAAIHGQTDTLFKLRMWPLVTKGMAERNTNDICEAFYQLSQLKYGKRSMFTKKEWKDQPWPKEIKEIDCFGYFQSLMFRFPNSSQLPESGELPETLKKIKKEGFLIGSASAPIELPEYL